MCVKYCCFVLCYVCLFLYGSYCHDSFNMDLTLTTVLTTFIKLYYIQT